MNQVSTPHFSRRVLLLGLTFLLLNLAIFAFKATKGSDLAPESPVPRLVSANPAEIEIETSFNDAVSPGTKDKLIFSGTSITTGENEFAELISGENVIKLDENTRLTLLESNLPGTSAFYPNTVRFKFALETGSIWVNASDIIEVSTKKATAHLHHTVGLFTYSEPINRFMVVTGDMDLSLLKDSGEVLTNFVLPLHNQITFVDTQITEVYSALKNSKLRKELKMTPISQEVLEDKWVEKNANDFAKKQEVLSSKLIHSEPAYKIRSAIQKMKQYITFAPAARKDLEFTQAEGMLYYILGSLQDDNNVSKTDEVIAKYQAILQEEGKDPSFQALTVQTLYAIETADFGTPAYRLKEALMSLVEDTEGPYVYRLYLSDLRRALYEESQKDAEKIAEKWSERWTQGRIKRNSEEYSRQSQIFNHTILSYIGTIPMSLLEAFDVTGEARMLIASDLEETRYEVTQERLQITASLVSSYRYSLAKQYLKNSYLSLDIESISPDLASTKIFLENGRLLAQRIEYAEKVLHGAAKPIDETSFREYFQNKTRDVELSDSLREFFDLEKKEIIESSVVEAPEASEVVAKFLEAKINVNAQDIQLIKDAGFTYKVSNARLIERSNTGASLSFDATYDFKAGSVIDLRTEEKEYRGSFTLADVVTLLKRGDSLTSNVYTPSNDSSGLDLLITDDEKVLAQEGQLIAQDVAKQLVFNELAEYGIKISEVKFNIDITDTLNLDKFKIKNALIKRVDKEGDITVHFDYDSNKKIASNLYSVEGVLLVDSVRINQLAALALTRIIELETEIETVSDFSTYVKQNNLFIENKNILYTSGGLLSLIDLEIETLGLKVSGLIDPKTNRFITVAHQLHSAQDIPLKEYFETLANTYTRLFMSENGVLINSSQIQTSYPFKTIRILKANINGFEFSFDINLSEETIANLKQEGSAQSFDATTLVELKVAADELKKEQQQKEAEAAAAAKLAEESGVPE